MINEVLDLKKKQKEMENPERYDSSPQQSPTAIQEPPIRTSSPIPVMITWSGPLYDHFLNTRLLAGAITTLCVVGLFFVLVQKNIFAAVLFFLSAVMLFVISRQSSPVVEFTVGPLSVKAGPREYKFSDIKSFWIEYNPGGIKELSLQVKKWYSPYIKIPLGDEDPVRVSTILLKFIPEEEHQDSMLDSFSRLLGV